MYQLTTRFHGDTKATKITGFSEQSLRRCLGEAIRTGYCTFAQLVAYEQFGQPIQEGRVLHTYGSDQ